MGHTSRREQAWGRACNLIGRRSSARAAGGSGARQRRRCLGTPHPAPAHPPVSPLAAHLPAPAAAGCPACRFRGCGRRRSAPSAPARPPLARRGCRLACRNGSWARDTPPPAAQSQPAAAAAAARGCLPPAPVRLLRPPQTGAAAWHAAGERPSNPLGAASMAAAPRLPAGLAPWAAAAQPDAAQSAAAAAAAAAAAPAGLPGATPVAVPAAATPQRGECCPRRRTPRARCGGGQPSAAGRTPAAPACRMQRPGDTGRLGCSTSRPPSCCRQSSRLHG